MRTTGERLKHIIENEGFNPKSFCVKFEMNYTGMNMIINNDRPLGMNILLQLKKAIPKLDANWLLFGEHENENVHKYEDNGKLLESAETAFFYDKLDPGAQALLKYLDLDIVQEKLRMILKK